MKLPSLRAAGAAARRTLVRFPMAIVSALGATAAGLAFVDHPSNDEPVRLLATCVLGLPLFVAAGTWAERTGVAAARRRIIELVIAAGLAGLFTISLRWTETMAALRFLQLLLGGHLVAAVAAYLAGHTLNGFWQFNRILLLRWLLAGLYAFVLWAGLSIALLALKMLFGLHVPNEAFPRLLVTLAFAFHAWFFLAGVPGDLAALDTRQDYPGGLKIFTQMVLMPLVVVYLVILTLYLGKVLVTRVWPSGWIGYLVSSVSAAGVLALLLVHPLRTREDSRWVNVYGRWFFIVLLPALGMLLVAIGRRIGQYGITEPRYFLLVLALWLTVLALYYAVTASQNIKLIPVSLGIVAFLTAAGPWGAYSVSRASQERRFAEILAANHLDPSAARTAPDREVSFQDRRELSATLRYLNELHGEASVARLFGMTPTELRQSGDRSENVRGDELARAGLQRLGLKYVDRWTAAGQEGEREPIFSIESRVSPTEEVSGFDVMRSINYPGLGWIGLGADSVLLVEGPAAGSVALRRGDSILVVADVAGAIDAALASDSSTRTQGRILPAPIVVNADGSGLRVRFVIRSASGRRDAGRVALSTWNGSVLVAGLHTRP